MIGEIQFNEWATLNAKNCPTPGCTYVFANDNNAAHNVNCPKCKKQFCTGCLLQHKRTVSCADAKLAIDKNKSNKANDDWIKKNTKACPHCGAAVQKNGGCRFIDCASCKHEFCWICLAKTPYKHAPHGCPAGNGYNMVDDNDNDDDIGYGGMEWVLE